MSGGGALVRLWRWFAGHAFWLLPLTVLILVLVAYVDRPLAVYFKSRDPADIAFFVAVNDGGNSKWYLVPTGIFGLLCLGLAARLAVDRRRLLRWVGEANLFLFASVAVSGLTITVLKTLFARSRPRLLFSADEYDWRFLSLGSDINSFPSGHSNTMFALALALGYLWPRWRWAFLLLAAPVAFARVVNTNHYLSDVLAGAAVAVLTAPLVHAWFASRGWAFEMRPGGSRLKAEGRLALARMRRPFGRRLAGAARRR